MERRNLLDCDNREFEATTEARARFFKSIISMKEIKRVYIAGKVSGMLRRDCEAEFQKGVSYALLHFGSQIIVKNPLTLCSRKWGWLRCMIVCMNTLRRCDTVVMLPNWMYSKGAYVENMFARVTGKNIVYMHETQYIYTDYNKYIENLKS